MTDTKLIKLYRYDDSHWADGNELSVTIYVVVKETPKGYWVVLPNMVEAYKENPKEMYGWAKPKFVLKDFDGKRLAYPTLKQALESYIKRKARQILLTTAQTRKAERMKKIAEGMRTTELKLPEYLSFDDDSEMVF